MTELSRSIVKIEQRLGFLSIIYLSHDLGYLRTQMQPAGRNSKGALISPLFNPGVKAIFNSYLIGIMYHSDPVLQ